MPKSIEEIEQEELQLERDIQEFKAGQTDTETAATADTPVPAQGDAPAADLTPEQQTGAAPITEAPAAEQAAPAQPDTATADAPAPGTETATPAAETAPEAAADLRTADAAQVPPAPGAPPSTETAAASADTSIVDINAEPADEPAPVETATDPAPDAAAVATPDPATTGEAPTGFAAGLAWLKSEVHAMAKAAWGEAVELEEDAKSLILKVEGEVRHVFRF